MTPEETEKLNTMDEHQALHWAESEIELMIQGCTRLVDLYALNPLKLDAETVPIVEALQRINDKLVAAHRKFEGLH